MKPFSKQTVMKKLAQNGLITEEETEKDDGENQPQKAKQSMLDFIIEQFRNGEITLPSLSKVYTGSPP
jgi:hypothetical protein